jgi:hypothetical protein
MTTKTAINGLDSGGQGWSTAIMQSQTHGLGEPPETGNGFAPCPAWIGEPYFSADPRHARSLVYFAGGPEGLIKIGFSGCVENRVIAVRRQYWIWDVRLMASFPGHRLEERLTHQHFAQYRDHGEWFERGPEILEAIEWLVANGCKHDPVTRNGPALPMNALEVRHG